MQNVSFFFNEEDRYYRQWLIDSIPKIMMKKSVISGLNFSQNKKKVVCKHTTKNSNTRKKLYWIKQKIMGI